MSEEEGSQEASTTTTNPLSIIGVEPASSLTSKGQDTCNSKYLLDFFKGGLLHQHKGALIEWGMPQGMGGRELLVATLASLWAPPYTLDGTTEPPPPQRRAQTGDPTWVLWGVGAADLGVYPPAWQARGIDLRYVRFVHTENPLVDLKPVFLDPLFSIIILDSPKLLGRDECAYLARRARAHGQTIMVLRDYFLSTGRGNVWAPLRLNCWFDHRVRKFRLRTVRGILPKSFSLSAKDFPCAL